ncbi:MAG: hypothetical protein ACJAY7_001920 [Pseudohongiellaceae bacterium]|jgi:hypothetical protein
MKNFTCSCGQLLFFENTRCLSCNRDVSFDPVQMSMYPISVDAQNCLPKVCKNRLDYDVCNWLVTKPGSSYCISCELNQTIPNLLLKNRRRWWKSLEHAKRRLIYSLLSLGLPVNGRSVESNGLAFQFIEDKRTDPGVAEEYVTTGHLQGLITINITEADDVTREISRAFAGELYRTLLGHFRHESGHYYFDKLINSEGSREKFRALFGDERADYSAALRQYYANKPALCRNGDFISRYAQSHPFEDWAEVWSHYLHMIDTLETAADYNLEQGAKRFDEFGETLAKWTQLAMVLNSLNRSMGLEDAYPFTLAGKMLKKLRFVHDSIYPS